MIKCIIQDYVKDFKGLKYEAEFNAFLRIDKFLIENNCSNKALTKEICDKWCAKRTWETINNRNHRVSSLRIITTYLNEIGIKSYVPTKGIYKKGDKYEAHIYTDDEIQRFFKAVDLSKSAKSECPFRPLIMPVFFRILYTSGMRVSLYLLRKSILFLLLSKNALAFFQSAPYIFFNIIFKRIPHKITLYFSTIFATNFTGYDI